MRENTNLQPPANTVVSELGGNFQIFLLHDLILNGGFLYVRGA